MDGILRALRKTCLTTPNVRGRPNYLFVRDLDGFLRSAKEGASRGAGEGNRRFAPGPAAVF